MVYNNLMTTEPFENALKKLQEAIEQPKDEFIRDSVIQRFEFTFELSWKTAKKIMGTQSVAPKIVIREMAQQGLINDTDVWFNYHEGRNLSVHTYKEELAEKVYDLAVSSVSDFKDLLKKLKDLE